MIRPNTTSLSQSPASPVRISPAFRKLPPPVIVIGMHRSGTSMVAGMLSIMGVFIDPAFPFSQHADSVIPSEQLRSDGYAESTVFRLLNESIMARAGANWFHVDPFLACRDQLLFARANVARMQIATYGNLFREHIAHHPDVSSGRWGWKDPRTSLLLPYWLQLFPHARLLHVRRQEDAIVNSLIRRANQVSATSQPPPALPHRAGRLLRNPGVAVHAVARRLGMKPSPNVTAASLQDSSFCHRLTERYVQECLRYSNADHNYLEVWYEDILKDPQSMVAAIAEFSELSPLHSAQQAAINLVGKGRRSPQDGVAR
jgi:hypothetical protein